jgi:branched-subunit amino acid aminotransferase/4-amino-4-deoxychorismate lyase
LNGPFVICDYGLIEASIIPASWLGAPGNCPAGVYETILLQMGRLVRLPDHLARFERGCRYLGLDPEGWSGHVTSSKLQELATVNGLRDVRSRIRIMGFGEPQCDTAGFPGSISFLGVIWPAPVYLLRRISAAL